MLNARLTQSEPIPKEAEVEIRRLLNSGDLFRYTAPKNAPVTLLEQEFAAMLGSRFALAVSSCSAALFLSLRALDLSPKARVLIPAFTFAAVPSAVVHADCTPVLVEVGQNYRIDIEDFSAKLDDSIKAVIISHMRGHTSNMDAILSACTARGIPVIEDAAHSLGTTWNDQNIGTFGRIGCFSFQSYKLVNGGEGGILVTDDEDLIARCVIMSGAYEMNWKKHGCASDCFDRHQNTLPLYNNRMSNLSAAVIRPQLADVPRRAADGLRNHDYVATKIETSAHISVPRPLGPERRAPDSIQFNLVGLSESETKSVMQHANQSGLGLTVFGLHGPNARVFWNWQFLDQIPDLPQTRAMLMRACDVRLPASLTDIELDQVVDIILDSVAQIKQMSAA